MYLQFELLEYHSGFRLDGSTTDEIFIRFYKHRIRPKLQEVTDEFQILNKFIKLVKTSNADGSQPLAHLIVNNNKLLLIMSNMIYKIKKQNNNLPYINKGKD